MKRNTKYLLAAILTGLAFTSCGDGFLTRDPYGATITEGQYEKLANQLEGTMRGIYSVLCTYRQDSEAHDEFGKRGVDMYTDLMSGDMALTNYNYGWFYSDEAGQGRTNRTGYLWSYYYRMLHNVNAVLKAAQGDGTASADNVIKRIASSGLPNTVKTVDGDVIYYNILSGDTLATYTSTEAAIAICYAQALSMRGYIYSQLLMLYCDVSQNITDFNTQKCFPMYNEDNMDKTQSAASMAEVYTQLESDLTNAIDYFEAFSEEKRSTKLVIDASVASGILAYAYLNKGKPNGHGDAYTQAYTNALTYAKKAISHSEENGCSILPRAELTKTGFNDVSNVSWIWGQQVTIETTGGLASWFGQCDIHSYSYAWSGDTKAIDENLYKLIPDYDARKLWFNDGNSNASYKYCPDGKFFSAKSPTSTKADDIDREWLSDNVMMRIEAMYLIAAEASYRLGDDANAISYLTAITDQRIAENMDAEYSTWKSGLSHSNLIQAIEYNWRVELWGEGYGLQTFRRLSSEALGEDERRRGGNHCSNAGSVIKPGTEHTFQIPSSEGIYNPDL